MRGYPDFQPPEIGFHVSPIGNRESILERGLEPRLPYETWGIVDQPRGVYLTRCPDKAAGFIRSSHFHYAYSADETFDLYRVELTPGQAHRAIPDPLLSNIGAFVSPVDIHPDQLEIISGIRLPALAQKTC